MSSIEYYARIVGFLFIGSIGLILGAIVLNFCIGFSTKYGILLPNLEPFVSSQRLYYFGRHLGGYRNIWQYQTDCVAVDDKMIYQPKMGVCNFENIEFKTRLTFGSNGRETSFGFDSEIPAIAVLGDSHAMGWGVNDDETFSAQLQKLTNRRVLNLAVSSYATERELGRLFMLEKANNIDTVIIQYCDNDLAANLAYPIDSDIAMARYIESYNLYPNRRENTLPDNFFNVFRLFVPRSVKDWIKTLLGRNAEANDGKFGHRKGIENILMEFSELLSGKHIIIFFMSGHNRYQTPSDWRGSFGEKGLNVDFVNLELEDDFFYKIDDHLNVHGHASIARQLSDIVK